MAANLLRKFIWLPLILSVLIEGVSLGSAHARDCAFDSNGRNIFGYRFDSTTVSSVCASDMQSNLATPELVAPPGEYSFSLTSLRNQVTQWSINARDPGVYRFFVPEYGSRQFIVWWPALGVRRLMNYLSLIYVHGNTDDTRSNDDLAEVALTRRISVTCGVLSSFLGHILSKSGIPSRIAQSITLRSNNGFDDGHIMLEIWIAKKWVLFDPDSRTVFGTVKNPLGVADLQNGFRARVGLNLTILGPGLVVDYAGFRSAEGVDYSLLEERSRLSEDSLERWYDRILGRVGVVIADTYYFVKSSRAAENEKIQSSFPYVHFVSVASMRKFSQ